MLFLVTYDRKSGAAIWTEYPDAATDMVKRDRLEARNRCPRHGQALEIVVLQAEVRTTSS